jgi:hypothetical protein
MTSLPWHAERVSKVLQKSMTIDRIKNLLEIISSPEGSRRIT